MKIVFRTLLSIGIIGSVFVGNGFAQTSGVTAGAGKAGKGSIQTLNSNGLVIGGPIYVLKMRSTFKPRCIWNTEYEAPLGAGSSAVNADMLKIVGLIAEAGDPEYFGCRHSVPPVDDFNAICTSLRIDEVYNKPTSFELKNVMCILFLVPGPRGDVNNPEEDKCICAHDPEIFPISATTLRGGPAVGAQSGEPVEPFKD